MKKIFIFILILLCSVLLTAQTEKAKASLEVKQNGGIVLGARKINFTNLSGQSVATIDIFEHERHAYLLPLNKSLQLGSSVNRLHSANALTVNTNTIIITGNLNKAALRSIDDQDFLVLLNQINGYTCHMKPGISQGIPEQMIGKDSYGFIAAEVKEIFPDLAITDHNTGLYAVNQLAFIPILTEILKSQDEKLDSLETFTAQLILANKAGILQQNGKTSMLYGDIFNIYSEHTEISYTLPENTSHAFIGIFDLKGALIQQIPIHGNDNGTTILSGNTLEPGMYLYSLICDGAVMDTRQMVLAQF